MLFEDKDKAADPLQRIKRGKCKDKEIKLEEIKIVKIHKDNTIIIVEVNPKDIIQDLKGILNARFSFAYKLQYHDMLGQILSNVLMLEDYHDDKLFI
jgi:hypothetical protein